MDEIEIIIGDDGSPMVKVHSMLDWFDGQVDAIESAKADMPGDDGHGVAFLAAQAEFIQELKEDLTASTLEKMDANTAS